MEFHFTTDVAPVQAEGRVAGRPFYFRARHNAWTFAVSEVLGVDPVDIDSPDAASGRGWFRSGVIGREWENAASHMSAEHATAIIRECAAAYIGEAAP